MTFLSALKYTYTPI